MLEAPGCGCVMNWRQEGKGGGPCFGKEGVIENVLSLSIENSLVQNRALNAMVRVRLWVYGPHPHRL